MPLKRNERAEDTGNALNVRNQSVLPHGVAAMTEEKYEEWMRAFDGSARSALSLSGADVE